MADDRTFPCGHTPEDCDCDPTPEQEAAAEYEETYFDGDMDDDEAEMLMECPYCWGDGQVSTVSPGGGRIFMDCPECGGTGWY